MISPQNVQESLQKHLLVDGYNIVIDLEKSHGVWLHDAKSGNKYLDMFTFFASLPLGFNHPKMSNAEFVEKLGKSAVTKVSNSDIYTTEIAETVETFSRVGIPAELPHLFFISGGALAVENCLKAAFDWKVRKNFAKGIKTAKGSKVIHFEKAFHGRTGYTLSLTNTSDPRKYQYFPLFDWPRVSPPAVTFPLSEANRLAVQNAEAKTLEAINNAINDNPDDIAAIIIEPIQGEGGDNHFRTEFFQALRTICDKNDIMLIFDEVQTGFGITGKFWAYENYGIIPDMVSFGKKSQVCGMLCSKRIEEVEKNVFAESSRINSTFGGNLVDIVRLGRILEIIEEENLLANAADVGAHLLNELISLQNESSAISNARGIGLFCAIDLPTGEERDKVISACYERKMIVLPCGTRSLRFRPALNVSKAEIDQAIEILKSALK